MVELKLFIVFNFYLVFMCVIPADLCLFLLVVCDLTYIVKDDHMIIICLSVNLRICVSCFTYFAVMYFTWQIHSVSVYTSVFLCSYLQLYLFHKHLRF